MKKKPNNTMNAAALMLGMSVERLEQLLDMENTLKVAQHEKIQIADMYKKLYEESNKTEEDYERLRKAGDNLVYVVSDHPIVEPLVKAWWEARKGGQP
jgi:hypothetical protein